MADLFAALSNEWMLDDRMYRYFDLLCLTRGAKVVKSQLVAMLRPVGGLAATHKEAGTPIALTPGFAREAKRERSWHEFLELNCLAVPAKQPQEARRSTLLSPDDAPEPRAGSLADSRFVDVVAELRSYYVSCLQGTA